MKNRVLNGIVMSFHAMAFWISAAFIIRMIIAVVKVFEIGDDIRYGDTFGDGYSVLLFIAGFLSYRKHTGLSVSVNLSPYKRVFCFAVASLAVSLLFSLLDMVMVRWYFTEIYGKELVPDFGISMEAKSDFISLNNAVMLTKMTLTYQIFVLLGYYLRHILLSKPSVLIFRCLLLIIPFFVLSIDCSENFLMELFSVIIILAILIFMAIELDPLLFCLFLLFVCLIGKLTIFILSAIIIWLMFVTAIAHQINKYKAKLPQEKRKGLIL